jgi:hypothetical protein
MQYLCSHEAWSVWQHRPVLHQGLRMWRKCPGSWGLSLVLVAIGDHWCWSYGHLASRTLEAGMWFHPSSCLQDLTPHLGTRPAPPSQPQASPSASPSPAVDFPKQPPQHRTFLFSSSVFTHRNKYKGFRWIWCGEGSLVWALELVKSDAKLR